MQQRGLSAKEFLILGLLAARPMYGLEMVVASRRKLKRGTVYVTLGRMEEKGLIAAAAVEHAKSGLLPRRRYVATERGRRVYELWQDLGALKP